MCFRRNRRRLLRQLLQAQRSCAWQLHNAACGGLPGPQVQQPQHYGAASGCAATCDCPTGRLHNHMQCNPCGDDGELTSFDIIRWQSWRYPYLAVCRSVDRGTWSSPTSCTQRGNRVQHGCALSVLKACKMAQLTMELLLGILMLVWTVQLWCCPANH
jgi:hypothetical protein